LGKEIARNTKTEKVKMGSDVEDWKNNFEIMT
jgi:hypothetical protein